jgi:uncharacterized membrane protein YGL010W
MRTLEDWSAEYHADHANPWNRGLHRLAAPLALWAAMALVWVVPVPVAIGRQGFWCALGLVALLSFYWRLSHPVAGAMLVVVVLLGLVTDTLYLALGPYWLGGVAVLVLIAAFAILRAGHQLEGRAPDARAQFLYLVIAPALGAAALLRRVGLVD